MKKSRTHFILNLLWYITKGMIGIIVIFIAVIATAASYLVCLPFLLFGHMKQLFSTEQA